MKNHLKKIIQNSQIATMLLYAYHNIRIQIGLLFGSISSSSGTTHAKLSTGESLKYIEGVFFDYMRIANISNFGGKVAELGPGDCDGVGLMFLTHGADHVDLVDRFYSDRHDAQQKLINKAILKKYPIRTCSSEYKDIESIKGDSLKRLYGKEASGEIFFNSNRGYNYIVSRSVLEHVDNPTKVLSSMFESLAPGGMLIHKVDLRDHGMMTPYGGPTNFLGIPEFIYRVVTKGSGYPNRFLFHRYKMVLESFPSKRLEFRISGLHGVEEDLSTGYKYEEIPLPVREKAEGYIEENKKKFAKHLQLVKNSDLSVSSFFFVCQK